MDSGIRAEVTIDDPPACPVADAAAATDAAAHSVTKSVDPAADGAVVEEFVLEADADLEADGGPGDLARIFSYGSSAVYRFEREWDEGCPCDVVESLGCPLVDVRAERRSLHLAFHAADMPELQRLIGELLERYPGLDVRRLLQSEGDRGDRHLVFVDRGALTDRQEEVLRTAHRMGYFEHPKGANASEVADELGITGSTVAEHLAAAQTKLLDAILDQ